MLTDPAFNALLKTLEEPPAHAVFVLATTEPHKVPVTILSRCQRYDFRRIPTGVIQAHLAKLAQQEGWQIDPEGLALIARAAEGGLRDAQGFLDQVVTFGGEGVSAAEIARILGVTDQGALLGALKAIIDRNGPDLLNLIEALYTQGQDLGRFYQDLVLYSRHLLVAGLHTEARHLAAVADAEWDELCHLARQTPAIHLHNLLSILIQGEEELKRSPQPRLALEVLLLRLIHLEPVLPLNEWLDRLEALERRLEAGAPMALGSAAATQKSPSAVQSVAAPVVSDLPAEAGLEDRWQALLQHVQKTEAPLYGKLAQCQLLGMSDHCLKLAIKRPWNDNGSRYEARLRELAQAFFGPETTVEFEVDALKNPKKSQVAPKKDTDMKKLQQQALEIFGGEWPGAPPEKEESE